jgi:CheY-like chemotaxis protein
MIKKKRSIGRAAAAPGVGAGSGFEDSRRLEVDHDSTPYGRRASVRGKHKRDKEDGSGLMEAHEYVLMAGKPGSKSGVKMEDDAMDVPNLDQLHVLVVDPDIESRNKTVSLLQECGYQVLSSKTGDEAFDVLKKEKENGVQVDVILKAHVPPKSVATHFLEQLRNSDEYKDILVIVYSNSEDRDAVARCLSLGAVDHWIKPLRRNEVVNLWTKVWQQRHKSGADGEVEAIPTVASNPSKRARKTKSLPTDDEILTEETPRTVGRIGGSSGSGQPTADISMSAEKVYNHKQGSMLPDGKGAKEMDVDDLEANKNHHYYHHHHHHHHHHHAKDRSPAKQSSIKKKSAGSKTGDRSDPSVQSAGERNDVAEVAEALTSLRSQKSSKPSSQEKPQIKPCTSPKTEDPSGASGQFKYTPTQMVMPYVSPSSWPNPLSYGQYPMPWAMPPPPRDSQQECAGGRVRTAEDQRVKSFEAQQAAWLRYQQQLHAMQMQNFVAANALQGNTRAFPSPLAPGGWPMNVQYFSNWGPGVMSYKGTNTYTMSHGDGSNSNKQSTNSPTANTIRLNAVRKYKEKRRARNASASKKIRYQSRKILADSRPRVRGQFVTGLLYESPSKNFDQSSKKNEDTRNIDFTKKGTLEPTSEYPDGETALGTLKTSLLKTSKCKDLASGLDDTDGNMSGYVDRDVRNPSTKPDTSRGRSDSGSNSPNYGGS